MTLKVKIVIVSILLLLYVDTAWALTFRATVDKTEATLQDQIMLTLSVEGTQDGIKPQLPELTAFDLMSRGSSTRMQIINNKVSSGVDYRYILVPKQVGTFEIGPATIEYNGKTITSNKITLTIKKADSQPQASKDVFVTAQVSNKTPYVNEQIIYTFKLYRRIQIANASLENPSFDGFRVEPLGKERQYEKVVNGRAFAVTEIKQALFPTREGTIEIEPAKIRCDVVVRSGRRGGFFDDAFFGFTRGEPKTFRSSPITVEVKPLPSEGMTPLFSGLVGNFSLTTSVSKKKLEVGDTTTLTISIAGSGNIKDAQGPEFPLLDYFKVYDDKPAFTTKTSQNTFGGTFTVKKALVPLKDGSLAVPSLSFTYFNPAQETFELAKSSPLMLTVLPSPDKEKLHLVEALGTTTSKEEVKILGKDILPLNSSLSALRSYRLNPWHWSYWFFFILPILGYAGLVVIMQRKRRWEEDVSYARSKSALKKFNKKISALTRQVGTEDSSEFYRLTSKAFKDFLGDKLNITGSAFTSMEIENRLHACTIQKEHIDRTKTILNTLESGQFAFHQLNTREKEDLLQQVKDLAAFFDKRIKK
jgi:hypothetical protein